MYLCCHELQQGEEAEEVDVDGVRSDHHVPRPLPRSRVSVQLWRPRAPRVGGHHLLDLGDEGSLHSCLRRESHAGLMGRREGAKKGGEGGGMCG